MRQILTERTVPFCYISRNGMIRSAYTDPKGVPVDWKLELVQVPVSDTLVRLHCRHCGVSWEAERD